MDNWDFDRDGNQDVAFLRYSTEVLRYYKGNGDGALTYDSQASVVGDRTMGFGAPHPVYEFNLIKTLGASFQGTNSTGHYAFNVIAPATPGTYPVDVNVTINPYFSSNSQDLTVVKKPTINSITFNVTPEDGKYVHLIANVTDDNLLWVNFTIRTPTNYPVVNNSNGTNASELWNSTGILLDQWGTYNYTIVAMDEDGYNATIEGDIDFIMVGVAVNDSTVNLNEGVEVDGQIIWTNGTVIGDQSINLYLNGTLQAGRENWWNYSWGYRLLTKIESSVSSNLSHVTTLVNFSTLNYISNNRMNSDCSDVRFVDNNSDELPFSLETSTCNSSNTLFWIWTNLTGNDNTSVYAYYGNSDISLKTDYTNPDDNLNLYMHFDNSSSYGENNTWAYDFSKNGNSGPLMGDAFIDSNGKFGGALHTDGSGDYVYADDDDSLDASDTDRITLNLWMNLDVEAYEMSSIYPSIIHKQDWDAVISALESSVVMMKTTINLRWKWDKEAGY